jgi:Domain of unknown function (DUF5925)/ATPase family associated with various cellular activities (AAA)
MTNVPRSSQRVMSFDDADSVVDAIDLLFVEHYISGSHPYAQSATLSRVREGVTLLPPGAKPYRVAVYDGIRSVLASGNGWVVCAVTWAQGNARVSVLAQSEQLAKAILESAIEGAEMPEILDTSKADVGFWHLGSHGPIRHERRIAVPDWSAIAHNYSASTFRSLDDVMSRTRDQLGGKLLLLHGPPGTGKTTALRALADAWRTWCQFDYVLDPERLFANSGYLLKIALGDGDENEGEDRTRILILEDCDELIATGAKERSGQGLARLLNLTDGLLGQGLSLLVAITTNEPVTHLHPAIVRPGRCIANVEVGPLSESEARRWLGHRPPQSGSDFTLAELISLQHGTRRPETHDSAVRVGQYL